MFPPKIIIEFHKPTNGYWDGGEKRKGEFEPDNMSMELLQEINSGDKIIWGSWGLNFYFTCKSGIDWKAATSNAAKWILKHSHNDMDVYIQYCYGDNWDERKYSEFIFAGRQVDGYITYPKDYMVKLLAIPHNFKLPLDKTDISKTDIMLKFIAIFHNDEHKIISLKQAINEYEIRTDQQVIPQ